MPQGRIVLKRISQSKKLADLETDGARLLYTWLITHVDVNGCFSADPAVVKGQVFTRLKHSLDTIEGYLKDLDTHLLILLYKTNSDMYLWIPDFVAKQPRLDATHEAKPTISPPSQDLRDAYAQQGGYKVATLSPTSKVKESKVNVNVKESKSQKATSLQDIENECFKQGLPNADADKIFDFCCRKKIKMLYSPAAFVTAWRLNPVGAEIELANAIKAREQAWAKDKKELSEATHNFLVKYGIEPPKFKKDETKPMTDAEREQRRQMIARQLK